MTPKKVLVDHDNIATFLCQKCKTIKKLNVLKYIGKAIKKEHLYRCSSCGNSFTVLLERRRFYRKEVAISGFLTLNGEIEKLPITIIDLSRAGLRIELEKEINLKIGEHMIVEFHLDNKARTYIQKEVVVRAICGLKVGTEFYSREPKSPIDKAYDIAIGFYTFSK